MKYNLLAVLLLLCLGCEALREATVSEPYPTYPELRYEDYIYVDSIHTPQFYRGGAEGGYPSIYLGDQIPLTLEFDEIISLDEPETQYWVDIVACDWDWRPVLVIATEFYDGFTRNRIDQYRRSEFTKVSYVHYQYQFPREGEAFKQSGNYLLKVFRNANEQDLVLTRRFVVADRRAVVSNRYVLDPNMERLLLSQLRFDVTVRGLPIYNPAMDLKVLILQNFRWDNAFHILRPRFTREESFEYLVQLPRAFEGGSEYRHIDLRSTRLYGRTTQEVEELEAHYHNYLFPDQLRKKTSIIQFPDINGSYFIAVNEWPEPDWQADYIQTHFILDKDQPFDSSEVYLYGGFTDWRIQDRYRLKYNNDFDRYEATALLKQGVYDYQYVLKHPGRPRLDETSLEGMQDADENFYSVLVYYADPADRRHQLLALQPLNYRN